MKLINNVTESAAVCALIAGALGTLYGDSDSSPTYVAVGTLVGVILGAVYSAYEEIEMEEGV